MGSGRDKGGRFGKGNKLAKGNGGRLPDIIRRLPYETAREVWEEVKKIAFDPQHRHHEEHAWEALKLMANKAFPTPQAIAVTGADGGPVEVRTWADLARDALRPFHNGTGDAGDNGTPGIDRPGSA